MDAALKELLQYGALGIMLALCIWYILKKDAAHKESLEKHEQTILEIVDRNEKERAQWRESIDNMYTNSLRTSDKIVSVIAELSEIIKNRIPR